MTVDGTRCDPTGRRVQQLDLNQDSRADMITLSRSEANGDKVTCKQADLNFDGHLDAFFHYDDDGHLVREQFDLDFDGRIDMGRFYEAGALTLDEQDVNQDGATDTWRRYDKGRLLRIESDRDADGRADMFTFYVGAQIDRIGYDVNGDGRVDRWDHDAARRARAALEARAKPPPAEVADSDDADEYVDELAQEAPITSERTSEDPGAPAPERARDVKSKRAGDAKAKRAGDAKAKRASDAKSKPRPAQENKPGDEEPGDKEPGDKAGQRPNPPASPNATTTPTQRPKADKGASAPNRGLK